MKRLIAASAMLALVLGLSLAAQAGEEGHSVTLTGKIMCAKCTLQKADAKECQDVLVVEGKDAHAGEYYLVKNDVLEKYGHVCKGEKTTRVTGTVEKKDGKSWLKATQMAEVKG